MRNGNERNSSSPSPIDCDVGLGLKMQSTETYSSCKRTTMASSPYYNYQQILSCGSNVNPTSFSGEADDGGSPLLSQLSGGGGGDDIYEAGVSSVLPMTFHNSGFRPTGVYGKAPFTASQWQELERQKIIHKYMMANIPVPPELLLPISRTSLAPVSQSSTPGLELRFPSSGSDLEPWRCKRTDGKKWRCSRDVAPDQKYCERHAHKSKARSRKPVEISTHKFTNNTTNNKTIQTTPAPFQRPTSLFPTMASATPYNDQTRSIEWFMRCGANNQQQWQQVFQTSSSSTTTLDFSRHNTDQQQPQYEEDKQPDFTSLNEPYIPHTNFSDSILELNANKTTRHFIDAWEKEGLDQIDGISHKGKNFSPSSSLTLSMSAGNGFDDEDYNFNGYLGIGMNNNNNNNNNNSENVNPVSWMNNSAPGGPLGEALCLGNASTTRGNSNLPSPRNSNTNTNNSSGCSKSSCEDGSHALNFIG